MEKIAKLAQEQLAVLQKIFEKDAPENQPVQLVEVG
jgi:hypothetical protein